MSEYAGRKAEFALGATYKTPSGLENAVTQSGNNVNADVRRAVSNQPKTSEAYAREAGYTSQAEMRAEDW